MKEYIIVSNSELELVEKKVNKMMAEGWSLAGGISAVYKHEHLPRGEHGHIPGHLVFSQALVR